MHPLMTVTASGARFAGAACAIDGSSDRALTVAGRLATMLGMHAVRIPREHRALYHAAAVLASGSLVTLQGAAERVASMTGIDRTGLAPLARAALDNWEALGARDALTGPIARGDDLTTQRLRDALEASAPDLVPLWDALATATRTLAAEPVGSRTAVREPLRIVRSIAELRATLHAVRRRGQRVGLVPTMGALHEGHLSLMQRARAECDVVVVSLFVNPAQFNDPVDLDAYPRDEAGDAELAGTVGVDIVFAPTAGEVYPDGFSTMVEVRGLTDSLEGEVRGPGHFRGVATVVTKLLNLVRPDVAYFGQKDAQQALVIRRLSRDLDFDTGIEVCPIVREADGLAMSSRNVLLTPEARAQATALNASLMAIADAHARGERSAAALSSVGRSVLTARAIDDGDVDYLAIVNAETLAPVDTVTGPALVAIAAHVGGVRLIDNTIIGTDT
jgi:pantoate--beta-alanine ligase